MKITKRQLRGIITEIVKGYTGHGAASVGGRKLGVNPPPRRERTPEEDYKSWVMTYTGNEANYLNNPKLMAKFVYETGLWDRDLDNEWQEEIIEQLAGHYGADFEEVMRLITLWDREEVYPDRQ